MKHSFDRSQRLVVTMMLFVFSVVNHALYAQQIQKSVALSKAVDLRASMRGKRAVRQPELAYTSQHQGTPLYYVFNYQDGGFAIMGGDERAREVLGYSETGVFNIDSIPDGLRYMLECYSEQIAHAIQRQDLSDESLPRKQQAAVTRTTVSPLLTTKWNQNSPFNSQIPILGCLDQSDEQCRFVTGCAATAMAQILKYYNYPVMGVGSHSYTLNYVSYNYEQTFSADFSNTAYDWGNMLDDYSGSYTADQVRAVGTLMYHAGVSLNMSYGWELSSASDISTRPAFVNYFGYDSGASMERRSNYTDKQWEDMVYGELEAGRPLFYAGQSAKGGHAFVCDGYSVAFERFHFNWGWGGYCDGWYPLTGVGALKPNGSGIGGAGTEAAYTSSQTAVIGLKPAISVSTVLVSEILLDQTSCHLNLGDTKQLAATVNPSTASNQKVIWSSSNTNVATVSASGLVTAVGGGDAVITCKATDGSCVNAKCMVVVTASYDDRVKVISENTAGAVVTFTSSGAYEWEWSESDQKLRSTNYHKPSTISQTTMSVYLPKMTDYYIGYSAYSEDKDILTVTIDGEVHFNWGGGYYGHSEGSILPGLHTFVFTYQKNSTIDSWDDRGYVYDIKFTTTDDTIENDISDDGVLDVNDVHSLVDYLITGNASGINIFAADLNGDGKITLVDLVKLISKIK